MLETQILACFGDKLAAKFFAWMYGQTYTQIEGKNFYYPDDIRRFLNGLPILD